MNRIIPIVIATLPLCLSNVGAGAPQVAPPQGPTRWNVLGTYTGNATINGNGNGNGNGTYPFQMTINKEDFKTGAIKGVFSYQLDYFAETNEVAQGNVVGDHITILVPLVPHLGGNLEEIGAYSFLDIEQQGVFGKLVNSHVQYEPVLEPGYLPFTLTNESAVLGPGLVCEPNKVIAGETAAGVISLHHLSDFSDTVTLTTSDPSVTVPSQVEISAGTANCPFTISTTAATVKKTVKIKATYHQFRRKQSQTIVRTTTITVLPSK